MQGQGSKKISKITREEGEEDIPTKYLPLYLQMNQLQKSRNMWQIQQQNQ